MKVLVADDERISRRLLARNLQQWGYQVVEAEDGQQAWDILRHPDAPVLAVMDWEMPGRDGIDICRDIRALRREPYTYILLLTARNDLQDVVEGLQAGADDYLTKPFDKPELKVRLRAGKRIVELHEKLIQARETLRQMALHDPLTGLLNRGAILERLRDESDRSRRTKKSLALILGDVDHFKAINDTHGHPVGDRVLCGLATRLKDSARSYDAVGRYGGEEFLIVVPDCEREEALAQARRLQQVIRKVPVDCGEIQIPVTMSMGLTVEQPSVKPCLESLIQRADQALYRAKENGRDRIEWADHHHGAISA